MRWESSPCSAQPEVPSWGVEAHAEELDVFWVFDDVARRLHVAIDGEGTGDTGDLGSDLTGDRAGRPAGDLPLDLRLNNRRRRTGWNGCGDRSGDLLCDRLGDQPV